MKRKFWIALLIACLSVIFAFALTACGETNGGNGGSNTGNGGNGDNGGTTIVTPGVDTGNGGVDSGNQEQTDRMGTNEDLNNIIALYGDKCIANASRFFTSDENLLGEFECVILDKEQTVDIVINQNFYTFSPKLDGDKITSGIFVKLEVKLRSTGETIGEPVYYNYGLMFSEFQSVDYTVSNPYNNEIWTLKRMGNTPNIVFEIEVTNPDQDERNDTDDNNAPGNTADEGLKYGLLDDYTYKVSCYNWDYICSSFKTIFCAEESKPNEWSDKWNNNCSATVIWGYKGE